MFKSIGIVGAFGAFGIPVLAVAGVFVGVGVVGGVAGYLIAGSAGAKAGILTALLS